MLEYGSHGPSLSAYLVVVVLVAVVVGGLLGVGAWWNSVQCAAKWEASGMAHDWSIVAGCRVEVSPGKWLPDERVRDVLPGATP